MPRAKLTNTYNLASIHAQTFTSIQFSFIELLLLIIYLPSWSPLEKHFVKLTSHFSIWYDTDHNMEHINIASVNTHVGHYALTAFSWLSRVTDHTTFDVMKFQEILGTISQRAKSLWKPSLIKHLFHYKVLDRCLINVNPGIFANWVWCPQAPHREMTQFLKVQISYSNVLAWHIQILGQPVPFLKSLPCGSVLPGIMQVYLIQ